MAQPRKRAAKKTTKKAATASSAPPVENDLDSPVAEIDTGIITVGITRIPIQKVDVGGELVSFRRPSLRSVSTNNVDVISRFARLRKNDDWSVGNTVLSQMWSDIIYPAIADEDSRAYIDSLLSDPEVDDTWIYSVSAKLLNDWAPLWKNPVALTR